MKLLLLFLFLGGFLSIVSKPLIRTDESKENDILLQEKLKQMIDQWKSDSSGKPFTAKQQAWWDSLGVRHPQSERKENVKLRREVRQLTDAEWRAYTDAVNTLNNLYPDPDDNRTQYQLFVQAHYFNIAPAAHGGAAFLVWHREYLWRMERALQLQNPDVTLPYWDTTLDRNIPDPRESVLFSEYLFGNIFGEVTTGPFAWFKALESCVEFSDYTHLYRGTDFGDGDDARFWLFNEYKIDNALDKTTYGNLSAFPAELEGDHAGPHFFVSGLMGNVACSPSDPIFYSHHGFIDWIFQEFRDHSQVTPLETEYPERPDVPIGGPEHDAFADMNPFPGLYNIHGLSTHYTDYYFKYAPRHYTSCVTSEDCTSQYLWCDVTLGRCVSKIHVGGLCTGLTDESCFGDSIACENNICTESSK